MWGQHLPRANGGMRGTPRNRQQLKTFIAFARCRGGAGGPVRQSPGLGSSSSRQIPQGDQCSGLREEGTHPCRVGPAPRGAGSGRRSSAHRASGLLLGARFPRGRVRWPAPTKEENHQAEARLQPGRTWREDGKRGQSNRPGGGHSAEATLPHRGGPEGLLIFHQGDSAWGGGGQDLPPS